MYVAIERSKTADLLALLGRQNMVEGRQAPTQPEGALRDA